MDYGRVVRQHFRAPRGPGVVLSADSQQIEGEAEDRTLNVWVRFQVETTQGVVGAARMEVYGCPHTIAAASWVAERLPGCEAGALGAVDAHELLRTVGAPAEKLGKMLLIEDALRRCWERAQALRVGVKEEGI